MPANYCSRRRMLALGSLGLIGMTLPQLLRAERQSTLRPRAKSCILFFLEGGPAHQDLWDMKPAAPAEVRGEFQPIETTVPGIQVCEHFPLLAKQMHHLALIRSVHHSIVDHNAGAYYALTGRPPFAGSRLIVKDEPENFPPFGAVLSRLRPLELALPPFVHIPEIMSNLGYDIPGERAGFLGPACDPMVTGDPSAPNYQVPGLSLAREMPPARLTNRKALAEQLDAASGRWQHDAAAIGMDVHYRRAYELLASNQTKRAFDLHREPPRIRERYGLPDRADRSVEARKFGGLPHLGQSMLLARRLIEAGVRLVTVCTGRSIDQAWDTHRQHFPLLKRSLIPYANQAFSALLEDLAQRGLLEETLVVAMGEFGRTPKLGQTTSNAGADAAGRDHWPHCYTVLMAGAGVRCGAVHGQSDRHAAYPVRDPVTPEDIAATIYHAFGIEPETRIHDALNRPHSVALGKPIEAIFD